jgi:hypothetical protein
MTLPSPAIRKLPLEVQSALSKLANIERELVSGSREHSWPMSGENIVGRLVGRDIYSMSPMIRDFSPLDIPPELEPPLRPDGVAIIPGYASGPCQPLLIVVMGSYDDQEKLILQTVEYVSARCRGATKYVIFYAISWSGMAWADHRDSFRASQAVPILKLLGSEPVILNPMY